MADFTKGEWKLALLVYDRVFSCYEDDRKRTVCGGCGSYYVVTPERLAQDRVIVKEMYEALKLYIEHQDGKRGHYCSVCHNEIEKAIEKVEGKTL